MALNSYQNYYNGLVNRNLADRLYNAQSVADRYSDTVENSYLNDAFNTRLTPQEEAVKQQWLATVGKDFARPGSTYDYDLNAFIKHNVVPNEAKPDDRNHLNDSGKKWTHPSPSNGALISDERMLGLARPTRQVGEWINFNPNEQEGRDYYRRLSPRGKRIAADIIMNGDHGGYIAGEANMWNRNPLQGYFNRREEGNILLDPRRNDPNPVPHTFSNYDYLQSNYAVNRLKQKDAPVEQPAVDPIDFTTGGLAGLRGVAVNTFKGIPWQNVARAAVRGAARNAAEGYALDAVGSEALKAADDAYDTYRAYQGAKRIPHIRIR